jgi:hypothetical protein
VALALALLFKDLLKLDQRGRAVVVRRKLDKDAGPAGL